jgi:uncharacterized protein
MNSYFVDSGYWIALENVDDQNHSRAFSHWQELVTNIPQLVTTSYIFDEVITFFNSRRNHAKAVELGHTLLTSSFIELVYVDETLFKEAWGYFQKHEDKRYSLTDCVSFVIMSKQNLDTALTFDKHFRQAGYQTLP